MPTLASIAAVAVEMMLTIQIRTAGFGHQLTLLSDKLVIKGSLLRLACSASPVDTVRLS